LIDDLFTKKSSMPSCTATKMLHHVNAHWFLVRILAFHCDLSLYQELNQSTASRGSPLESKHLSTYWQLRKLRHNATAIGVSSFK
jgi:hypothetical protein